jgi:hypothetical protein
MGTTSRVIVASRPKVSFLPGGSTSPRNCGCELSNPVGGGLEYLHPSPASRGRR